MISYERINKSEEIDFNKSVGSKEFMICHYWYFSGGFKYQLYVCNACHDFNMAVQNLSDFFIVTAKSVDYRCCTVGVNRNDTVNLLNNSVLSDKGVL